MFQNFFVQYTNRRRMKVAKYELASRHHGQVILLRTLVAWKHYNKWMKEVHHIAERKRIVKCVDLKRCVNFLKGNSGEIFRKNLKLTLGFPQALEK